MGAMIKDATRVDNKVSSFLIDFKQEFVGTAGINIHVYIYCGFGTDYLERPIRFITQQGGGAFIFNLSQMPDESVR